MEITRILVVEDDNITAMLLTDVLENVGYTVTTVLDGAQAQQALTEARNHGTPYTVVITDLIMEGVDGIGVLRTARQQEPHAEVIVLTGFGSLTSAIDALRAGAYDYLLKPCKVTQLLSCVASAAKQVYTYYQETKAIQHLNEAQAEHAGRIQPISELARHASHQVPLGFNAAETSESALYDGPLHLDRFRDVAVFNGTEIDLTPTEYLLLYCLLEAQGRVLSYQEIARNTHGYQTSNAEAQMLLKAHVSHLRHKIDPSFVINVRGIGYRLATSHSHTLADGSMAHGTLKNTLSKG